MRHLKKTLIGSAAFFALTAGGLALWGCQQQAPPAAGPTAATQPAGALPPVNAAVPLVPAPAVEALPPAPPPPMRQAADPRQAYAFSERAYELGRAFADAPPDYTYDDQGVRPWFWRSGDGYVRVAEAIPGGERYYYYAPGSNDPFYVQGPDYGYGFEGGQLVAVYGHGGQQLAWDEARLQAERAGQYLARAHQLYDDSQRAQHLAVAEANWQARRDAIAAQQAAWAREQQADADWAAYHNAYGGPEEATWDAERARRLQWAAYLDQQMNDQARAQREWQEALAARQGPPPPAYAPAGPPPTLPASQQLAQQRAQLAAQQAVQRAAAEQQAATLARAHHDEAAAAAAEAKARADEAAAAAAQRAATQKQALVQAQLQAQARARQQAAAASERARVQQAASAAALAKARAQAQAEAAARAKAEAEAKSRSAAKAKGEAAAHGDAPPDKRKKEPERTQP